MTIQGGLSASAVFVILSAGIAVAAPPAAGAKAPAPGGPARSAPTAPAEGHGTPLPQPQVSQDAAARSRMHECGHQWSTMKKAGTVGTLTWKEFSATCLVVSK